MPGWALQSAWGKFDDECALTCAARSAGGTTLATVDSFARLRLWRFPCAGQDPGFVEVRGHGGAVSACAFVLDDSYLLTAGEDDCCVMQWRFVVEVPPPPATMPPPAGGTWGLGGGAE